MEFEPFIDRKLIEILTFDNLFPSLRQNWTYATGRERKEDDKPSVTGVLTVMFGKKLSAKLYLPLNMTKHASYRPVIFPWHINALPSSSFCCYFAKAHYSKTTRRPVATSCAEPTQELGDRGKLGSGTSKHCFQCLTLVYQPLIYHTTG